MSGHLNLVLERVLIASTTPSLYLAVWSLQCWGVVLQTGQHFIAPFKKQQLQHLSPYSYMVCLVGICINFYYLFCICTHPLSGPLQAVFPLFPFCNWCNIIFPKDKKWEPSSLAQVVRAYIGIDCVARHNIVRGKIVGDKAFWHSVHDLC